MSWSSYGKPRAQSSLRHDGVVSDVVIGRPVVDAETVARIKREKELEETAHLIEEERAARVRAREERVKNSRSFAWSNLRKPSNVLARDIEAGFHSRFNATEVVKYFKGWDSDKLERLYDVMGCMADRLTVLLTVDGKPRKLVYQKEKLGYVLGRVDGGAMLLNVVEDFGHREAAFSHMYHKKDPKHIRFSLSKNHRVSMNTNDLEADFYATDVYALMDALADAEVVIQS